MRKFWLSLFLLAPLAGHAQSVQQSGNVTPGHSACWAITGVIYDCGTPGGSSILGPFTANDLVAVNGSGSLIDSGINPLVTSNWTGQLNLNGGATAPTLPPGDNSTHLATTAYVFNATSNPISPLIVGTSLFPTIVPALTTTVTAVGSGSPNITVSSGVAAQTTNGQLISGAVVPGGCCYFVLSGGGTTSIVMSGNASGSGALGAIFGLARYDATSSEIVNTIGVETLLAGAAAKGNGNWTGGWDTPSPFTSLYTAQFVSPNGTHAASFASRQSDNTTPSSFPSPQTINILTVIDVGVSAGGWGMYMEADVTAPSSGGFLQVESDIYSLISNPNALASSNPYTYNATGHTTIYRAGAGAGRTYNGVTSNNVSTAFEVIYNLSEFEVGYLCGNTALDVAAGRVGQCVAMADNQGITWYTGSGQGQGSGTISSQIYQLLNSTTPILHVAVPSNGFIQFDVGGSGQIAIESAVLFPSTNNNFDLGTSSLGFKDIYGILHQVMGTSAGIATIAAPASFSSYNFNLPTTPGTTGFVLLSAGGGSSPMTWANSLSAFTLAGLTTFSGQFITTFGTPSIASGACGATTNGSASGTNQAGLVTIGAAPTTTCTINFSTTITTPNSCVLFPANAAAAATGTTVASVSGIGATSFVITGSALANSKYYFLCI